MKIRILVMLLAINGTLLMSCREEVREERVIREVEVEREVEVDEVEEENEGILERTAKEVDKEVNEEINEEIDKIGDDN